MHMRVRPSVKGAAEPLAPEDGRSLANWLERLIEASVAKRYAGAAVPHVASLMRATLLCFSRSPIGNNWQRLAVFQLRAPCPRNQVICFRKLMAAEILEPIGGFMIVSAQCSKREIGLS
jgi:hypothetical protein